MKSNKITYGLLIVFSISLLAALCMYIAGTFYFTDTRMYEGNWNITLPGNLKKQYGVSSIGALGDGYCYTIYELKDNNAPFLKGASAQKNTKLQKMLLKFLTAIV